MLEDLNSTNGIYVRSKRVRRRMLNDGDVVQVGQHVGEVRARTEQRDVDLVTHTVAPFVGVPTPR